MPLKPELLSTKTSVGLKKLPSFFKICVVGGGKEEKGEGEEAIGGLSLCWNGVVVGGGAVGGVDGVVVGDGVVIGGGVVIVGGVVVCLGVRGVLGVCLGVDVVVGGGGVVGVVR